MRRTLRSLFVFESIRRMTEQFIQSYNLCQLIAAKLKAFCKVLNGLAEPN